MTLDGRAKVVLLKLARLGAIEAQRNTSTPAEIARLENLIEKLDATLAPIRR